MRDEHWERIAKIAARQDGLVSASQLRIAGASPAAIDRLIRAGRLSRVRHGVVAVAGAPSPERSGIRAVTLARPTAVISHRSAAWLHGLLHRRPEVVDIIVTPKARVAMKGVVPHRRRLDARSTQTIDGIRLTRPEHTIVDLTEVLQPQWVERLLHAAVMRHLCEYSDVGEVLSTARYRRQRGLDRLRAAIGDGQEDSPLEVQWAKHFAAAGLPSPEQQHQVVVDSRVFVLDFAWPDQRVALEANGYGPHRTRIAFDRDHEKVLALRKAGWEVLSVTSRTPPEAVLPLLAQLLPFSTATGAVEKGQQR